jgi:hypothetical protein
MSQNSKKQGSEYDNTKNLVSVHVQVPNKKDAKNKRKTEFARIYLLLACEL